MQETIDNQIKIINLLQASLIESLEERTSYNKRTLISGDENKCIETDDHFGAIAETLSCIEDAARVYSGLKANLD